MYFWIKDIKSKIKTWDFGGIWLMENLKLITS